MHRFKNIKYVRQQNITKKIIKKKNPNDRFTTPSYEVATPDRYSNEIC